MIRRAVTEPVSSIIDAFDSETFLLLAWRVHATPGTPNVRDRIDADRPVLRGRISRAARSGVAYHPDRDAARHVDPELRPRRRLERHGRHPDWLHRDDDDGPRGLEPARSLPDDRRAPGLCEQGERASRPGHRCRRRDDRGGPPRDDAPDRQGASTVSVRFGQHSSRRSRPKAFLGIRHRLIIPSDPTSQRSCPSGRPTTAVCRLPFFRGLRGRLARTAWMAARATTGGIPRGIGISGSARDAGVTPWSECSAITVTTAVLTFPDVSIARA